MWVGSTQCHPGTGQDQRRDPLTVRGCPASVLEGPPGPLCVICPRGWLGLEEGHFPTVPSWQCPPRGKPTVCRLNGDPVLCGLLAMHIPGVLECPNVCTSSGWDLAPQNASPAVRPPRDSHSARLPAWDPGCHESAVIPQPNKPSCGPCLHPCGQIRVSSLLGGGLSPPHRCQTHVCVPGHPGL